MSQSLKIRMVRCSNCSAVAMGTTRESNGKGNCYNCMPRTFDAVAERQKELWLSGASPDQVYNGEV